jgi:hypothetical protein
MDPRMNPYAPGAGTIPPELAGREVIVEKVSIALDRCRNGLSARGFLLVGLRGVGKTVLLTSLAQNAEADGFVTISIETPEKRSLPALLIPAMRSALLKLDWMSGAEHAGKRALRILGSFVSAMKIHFHDVEFGLDLGQEEGVADSGDLAHDLATLFLEIGKAAQNRKTAFVLFIDEIQYIDHDQFAALIMAIHKCAQHRLPLMLVGAGLPQLVGQAGKAKSYAERLFEYPEIGPLSRKAACEALEEPAKKLRVAYDADALEDILTHTQAYPYFLQEWGKQAWDCAAKSPITREDVQFATKLAISELDASFFRVRYDRLTPAEKRYLRTMAELGLGPHRSGDIAHLLNKDVKAVAPVRAALIRKGMIYSQAHGDNRFTVPLFEAFMKRVMPEFQPED